MIAERVRKQGLRFAADDQSFNKRQKVVWFGESAAGPARALWLGQGSFDHAAPFASLLAGLSLRMTNVCLG